MKKKLKKCFVRDIDLLSLHCRVNIPEFKHMIHEIFCILEHFRKNNKLFNNALLQSLSSQSYIKLYVEFEYLIHFFANREKTGKMW